MNTLKTIFQKHNCDKASKHTYDRVYEMYFDRKRNEPIKILEIGIFRGESINSWHEYFPNAEIYGIDVFSRIAEGDLDALKKDRVHFIKGDSTCEEIIDIITEKWGGEIKFDFIIDDGLHTPRANNSTFTNLFRFLKADGAYFIEDVWPLDIMSDTELCHPWVSQSRGEYGLSAMSEFVNSVGRFDTKRYDLRFFSGQPDSYVFRVKKEEPTSTRNRRIDQWVGSDVVFTSYFSSKPNPQTGEFVPSDNISYLFPWISSLNYNKIRGVVIHDGLSNSFIEKYQNENIIFYKYTPGGLSLNDERFLAVNDILQRYQFNRVLLTDASDLFIKKDPFKFMSDPRLIYCGSDVPSARRVRDNGWCMKKIDQLFPSGKDFIEIGDEFLDFNYVNAGVVGGYYDSVKPFVNALAAMLSEMGNQQNNNMMLLNYLLWRYSVPYFSGKPFTSEFKKYQLDGDYFIIHK